MRYTLKYKLYNTKKNKRLDETINLSGRAYNHILSLHKRWYRLFGSKNHEANLAFEQAHGRKPNKDERRTTYLSPYRIQQHLTKLKKTQRYAWMRNIPSQALQQIAERIDAGYQKFFDMKSLGRKVSPPKFKRVRDYRSFTLKQAGWRITDTGRIVLCGRNYRFAESRPVTGNIKTVSIVRDHCGGYFVCFSCEAEETQSEVRATTGRIAGMDFGLKTFLTIAESADGKLSTYAVEAPRPLFKSMKKLRAASKRFSKRCEAHKKKSLEARREWERNGRIGDKPYVSVSKKFLKAKLNLARLHKRVANQRSDWQWKQAHELACKYDAIYVEDLSFTGMARMWGRKTSDAGPGGFFLKLEHECAKNGSSLVKRDRYYASTQICSECGYRLEGKNKLTLKDRKWTCPECGKEHDRDINALRVIPRMNLSGNCGKGDKYTDGRGFVRHKGCVSSGGQQDAG